MMWSKNCLFIALLLFSLLLSACFNNENEMIRKGKEQSRQSSKNDKIEETMATKALTTKSSRASLSVHDTTKFNRNAAVSSKEAFLKKAETIKRQRINNAKAEHNQAYRNAEILEQSSGPEDKYRQADGQRMEANRILTGKINEIERQYNGQVHEIERQYSR
ncbi:hypothetical protein ERX35_006985 [Macrococcus equipercicus]|uniref:Lipoprotein n=1 Tax=Macrococcus equipercicus TaxID=69967 RepID=A0ABQ6R871_9STAP|nr:hypothetical protein [Macrococcus equipercicus]KAA1039310.1 hypothetical protein ERX35_006985 [Macrococcus equipercicus]